VALSKVDSPILWFVDGETWKMINFPILHQISMTAPELYLGQKYPWLGDLVKFSLEKIIDLRQKYPTNPIKIKRSKRGSMGFSHCKDMLGKFVIARKFQRRFIDGKEGGDLKSFISLVTGQNQRPHKRPRNPPPLIFTQQLHQMDNYLRVLVTYHNEKLWHCTAEKCFEYQGMLKQRAL
jgi:hypothetical protein